jgi:hypothetical protein
MSGRPSSTWSVSKPTPQNQGWDATVSNAGSNILSLQINDAISVWVRQRLQEHRVNNAKDCGVPTDARRKREHGNGGKAGVFYEHSQCEH